MVRRFVLVLSALALVLTAVGPVAAKSPTGEERGRGDNLPGKLAQKQIALKQKALDMVLKGKANPKGPNKVVEVAKGQFVELELEGTDQILTLLGEFGDLEATHDHGTFGVVNHNGDPGPAHNEIPEPDREVDNTTIWTEDFSQAHFDDLLYSPTTNPSMANFYLEQSSGRYTVDGYVSDWVQVPFNAAAYGSNYCGSIVCTRDVGRFLDDQADNWWPELVAEQGSEAAANAFLATFDIWDRYDYDADGDFDEPDGYIDHYQSVHAGEGEETGGGAQGEDAIWSHRSYANAGAQGAPGPTVGGTVVPFGGARIGTSQYWIGDYTVEPENGGVGVFAHEFAHDYNIPDLYDTSGNTGGAENGTAWWTLMSQGSYGSVNGEDLGSAPVHLGAWEKFQLGWLNYDVAVAGQKSSHKLGPAETNTRQSQGLFVILPPKMVQESIGAPYAGESFYHSGAGDDLLNSMSKDMTLGAGPITASFQARYHIETCWDYAYLQVSTNGGTSWTNIDTSASTDDDENGNNQGNGITGVSGSPKVCDDLDHEPAWVNVTADLSAYANSTVRVRFLYDTDPAVTGEGFGFDDLAITGLATDGAETDTGWTFNGFSRTTGSAIVPYNNYYLAEFRQYRGYDDALELGPYNFIDPNNEEGLGNYVEHFPYQDGLLISYWDTSQHDNNVGDHPGEGLLLPIDAHPTVEHWSDGSTARPRIQSYDATFGFSATDALSLHSGDLVASISSKPGVSTFNDLNDYWVSGDPGDAPSNGRYQAEWNSVNTPNTGTTIRIVTLNSQGNFMQVNVNQ